MLPISVVEGDVYKELVLTFIVTKHMKKTKTGLS